MREAIGGTWLFNLVIFFVLLFAGYMCLSINYSKAFGVKDKIINELERKLETLEVPEVRLEKAKQSIQKILDFDYNGVNDQIIEEIVEKVIVHKDYFKWKLNFMTDTIKLQIIGKNKADCYVADYEKK